MSDAAKESSVARPVFSPVIAFAMVGIGALSLLFYLLFSAYAPDYSGEGDTRTNAVSQSAVGFAGLAEFLRLQGIPVLLSRGLEAEEYEKASLIVLTPGLNNTGAEDSRRHGCRASTHHPSKVDRRAGPAASRVGA